MNEAILLSGGELELPPDRGYDVDMTDSIMEVPMKTAPLKGWTYEEFMTLPEGGACRYEIIEGELFMTPSPNSKHQEISGNLFAVIWTHLRSNPFGKVFAAPYDVVFSQDPLQVTEPDLVFVSKAHASIITEKNIQGVPDLLIEILSPGTAATDRRVKRALYERFGVPEYWIVDPEAEAVQVFRLSNGRYGIGLEFRKEDALDSHLLPGLSIPLATVFSA
ncbi:MAG: Uma2 family endonuclease [Leptospirillum sp.]